MGLYASLALDAADMPHISYVNESSDELQLADWDGSAWNSYTPVIIYDGEMDLKAASLGAEYLTFLPLVLP